MARAKVSYSKEGGIEGRHIVLLPDDKYAELEELASERRMATQDLVAWIIQYGLDNMDEIDDFMDEGL